MTSSLARPRWAAGQVLVPEHFLGLEQALSAEAALRAGSVGVPVRGIVRLDWNGDDLRNGVLWVGTLTAFLDDGGVVDVPGNATLVAPLDLNMDGRRTIDVYAHVLAEDGDDAGCAPPSGEIARTVWRIVLSAQPAIDGSRGRIDLGRFEMDDLGQFQLNPDIVPPLVSVCATPYLKSRLDGVTRELAEVEAALDELALRAVAGGSSALALLRARTEVRKAQALLSDLAAGTDLHPYLVFAALRSLALELGVLDENAQLFSPPAYEHDHLGRCFNIVVQELSARARIPTPDEPALPFIAQGGRLVASEVPTEALEAAELYVAVLKARVTDRVSLDGTVVASPGRLRCVQEHSLRSMRLVPATKPPLRHAFGGPVAFFSISGAGRVPGGAGERREWSAVVHERAMAFPIPREMEGARAFLCWKMP